jgi:hypothetical protein
MTNNFRTAITCRWGKFIGDALLNPQDAGNFQPELSPTANMSLVVGVNNQISSTNQQVFPTVNPVDAINWADTSGRVGLCTVSAIREEGVLKTFYSSVTIDNVAVFNTTLTPATGKKWVLKSINMIASFTGTVGYFETLITPVINNGGGADIYFSSSITAGTKYNYQPPQVITMQAGDVLALYMNITAKTVNGTGTLLVMVQESDA